MIATIASPGRQPGKRSTTRPVHGVISGLFGAVPATVAGHGVEDFAGRVEGDADGVGEGAGVDLTVGADLCLDFGFETGVHDGALT